MSAVSILNRACKTFTENCTVSEQIGNLPVQGECTAMELLPVNQETYLGKHK